MALSASWIKGGSKGRWSLPNSAKLERNRSQGLSYMFIYYLLSSIHYASMWSNYPPLNVPCACCFALMKFRRNTCNYTAYGPIFVGRYHFLGCGFKHFYFHPYLGKIPILTNIFQMGETTIQFCSVTIKLEWDHFFKTTPFESLSFRGESCSWCATLLFGKRLFMGPLGFSGYWNILISSVFFLLDEWSVDFFVELPGVVLCLSNMVQC